MRIIRPKRKNPGDKTLIDEEERIEDISFNVFKFGTRTRPQDPRRITIICCFNEFGCETVGTMYCLPQILQANAGRYFIAVGWYGREYLYRHLVDEFWEIKEEHQWLREHSRAFSHQSKNLTKVEEAFQQYGRVYKCADVGNIAVSDKCNKCGDIWYYVSKRDQCEKCESTDITRAVFSDVPKFKKRAIRIPRPTENKLAEMDKYVKPNSVGIFARNRRYYGRNLSAEFYIELIKLLEDMGYSPIWLGEKQTTLSCPVDHIVDFSRMEESRDLENTLAIISKLRFTIQFWTASTRLAGMLGVPYILFESPDQIFGKGQEGIRRKLCDVGPSKLVIAHYLHVNEHHDESLQIVKKAVNELESQNYKNILDLLKNDSGTKALIDLDKNKLKGMK